MVGSAFNASKGRRKLQAPRVWAAGLASVDVSLELPVMVSAPAPQFVRGQQGTTVGPTEGEPRTELRKRQSGILGGLWWFRFLRRGPFGGLPGVAFPAAAFVAIVAFGAAFPRVASAPGGPGFRRWTTDGGRDGRHATADSKQERREAKKRRKETHGRKSFRGYQGIP